MNNMVYTKEDFKIDNDWLQSQGVDTLEREIFIIGLIKQGFTLTKKEYVELMDEIKQGE